MRLPGFILIAVLVSGCAAINPPEFNYVGTVSKDCKSLTIKHGKITKPKSFKISPLEAISLAYSTANRTCSQKLLDVLYSDAKYYYVYKFRSQAESLTGPVPRDILKSSIIVSGTTGEVVRK
jgi:hypothetical protein